MIDAHKGRQPAEDMMQPHGRQRSRELFCARGCGLVCARACGKPAKCTLSLLAHMAAHGAPRLSDILRLAGSLSTPPMYFIPHPMPAAPPPPPHDGPADGEAALDDADLAEAQGEAQGGDEMDGAPLYVNARQFARILQRRIQRARLEQRLNASFVTDAARVRTECSNVDYIA